MRVRFLKDIWCDEVALVFSFQDIYALADR